MVGPCTGDLSTAGAPIPSPERSSETKGERPAGRPGRTVVHREEPVGPGVLDVRAKGSLPLPGQ